MMRAALVLVYLQTTTPLQCPHGRRIMTRRPMSPNDIMTATEWGRLMTDASAGLVGGSVGVMGTLAVYENNRFHAKQRSICAYCEGTGFIKGASYQSSSGDWLRKADGVCINCEGTGLSIPATLDRKGIKQQDDELETKLDEIGIAALADDIVRAENSPGDMLEVTRMLQRRALARAGQKKPLTEAEKCVVQCFYSFVEARRCKPFSHKHSQ